jgi:hypothetical protein
MTIGNAVVSTVLRSPVHGLLSATLCLVCYTGRRSGRTITTPVQYIDLHGDVVILRPKTGAWLDRTAGRITFRDYVEQGVVAESAA